MAPIRSRPEALACAKFVFAFAVLFLLSIGTHHSTDGADSSDEAATREETHQPPMRAPSRGREERSRSTSRSNSQERRRQLKRKEKLGDREDGQSSRPRDGRRPVGSRSRSRSRSESRSGSRNGSRSGSKNGSRSGSRSGNNSGSRSGSGPPRSISGKAGTSRRSRSAKSSQSSSGSAIGAVRCRCGKEIANADASAWINSNKYTHIEWIADGSRGQVFHGRFGNRCFAIKKGGTQRENEALLECTRRPVCINVVELEDAEKDQTTGQWTIVMELGAMGVMESDTYFNSQTKRKIKRARREAKAAVAQLHAKGYTHNDLSTTNNWMFFKDGSSYVLKLIDLGDVTVKTDEKVAEDKKDLKAFLHFAL